MTKDELKPIDVSKYRVTETGQVLKMTNEELAKKADSNHALVSQLADLEAESTELKEDLRNKKLAIQNRNGRIKELEEKISVLLSCKNCPDNKGGLVCQKEYEDKCLTQKIQFIKELQEEIAELKDDNKVMADNYSKMEQKFYDNFTKAKELLAKWVELFKPKGGNIPPTPIQFDTERFLKDMAE